MEKQIFPRARTDLLKPASHQYTAAMPKPSVILVICFLQVLTASADAFDAADANVTLHLAWTAYCNESAIRAWNCQVRK